MNAGGYIRRVQKIKAVQSRASVLGFFLASALIFSFASTTFAKNYDEGDYDKICKDQSKTVKKLREKYCKAAKEADTAKTGHIIGTVAWAAVAITCANACLITLTPGTSHSCTYLNYAGTVADIGTALTLEKDTQAAITTIGGAAVTYFTDGYKLHDVATKEEIDAAAAKDALSDNGSKQQDLEKKNEAAESAACTSAVVSVVKAGVQGYAIKNDNDTFEKSLKNAEKLTDANTEANVQSTEFLMSGGSSAGGVAGGVNSATAQKAEVKSNNLDVCNDAKNKGNSQEFISCVVANDPQFPKIPAAQLAKDFKDATGLDLDKFLKNNSGGNDSASKALGQAFGAKDGTIAEKTEVFRKMEDAMAAVLSQGGPAYAGSGGGSSAKKKDTNSFDNTVKGILDQLMPKEKNDALAGTAGDLDFTLSHMNSDDVPKTDISLFHRVGRVYRLKRPNMAVLPYRLLASDPNKPIQQKFRED